MYGLTWPELVELGAPKMEGQFLASRPMSNFNKIKIKNFDFFFNEPNPLDYVETPTTLCYIMLDQFDYARFIEPTWLLGPKAFTYGKLAPVIILL
jgi:hypothetical protein